MTSAEIRTAYLKFFEKNGHTVKPSTPLIPQGDASLMFNSAGMVPFKPYFLGLKKDLSRAASCQKCFRTTDIDRVGTTLRHMTFFEMLGNFSFGDYFKDESIAWAWEFLTDEMGFEPKRLFPTVFKEDDEADKLWRKLGTPNAPIRLGEDSNFWNMGPTGPCGPCSEIYFDRGPAGSCGKTTCAPGCDCDRYLEIWNLVFTQFDRQEDGSLKPLPRKNIDTGMGLERLVFSAEGRPSPFDTDLFIPVVATAMHILGVDRKKSPEAELAYRVIADHSRAAVLLMSEGVVPSNVERGYVLRRLIRRAVRYGQLLGHAQPFLHRLVPSVVEIFDKTYPDLRDAASQVESTLKTEEEKFLETLAVGERELKELLATTGKTLPGDQAFKLYDTFGFPLELTREICAQKGVSVDEEGFKRATEEASKVARASWKGSGQTSYLEHLQKHLLPSETTEFIGYEQLEAPAIVVAFETVGSEGLLVLDKTPFYAEGGGQVGDAGLILSENGKETLARVVDTQRQGTVFIHRVVNTKPEALRPATPVRAQVDSVRRGYIAPHHTATHLLNEALRRMLGTHVHQAGSYVGADKLRFDFTNPKGLDPETLKTVEQMVNDEINRHDTVATKVEPIEKVKEYGAVTLLGENYGEKPRFVLIGPKGWADHKDRYSLELCGGTHVSNTAEIAAFRVLKESSVAAGVRRIEAVAGKAVADFERLKAQEGEQTVAQLRERERELLELAVSLGGRVDESPKGATETDLRVREKELRELIGRLRAAKLVSQAGKDRSIVPVNGVKLCAQKLEGADPKSLRGLSDRLKTEIGSGLVFLATPTGNKLSFVLNATPDLAAKGVDAAKIAKALAAARGGSAGGRSDFAQGGVADGDWGQLVDTLASLIKV
ncbi:MAG: alanine--tRNA ligase [Elusimicrobia bacterium]|nr:alanine--tRNA ligase [Elusimicrobiota bacterium]